MTMKNVWLASDDRWLWITETVTAQKTDKTVTNVSAEINTLLYSQEYMTETLLFTVMITKDRFEARWYCVAAYEVSQYQVLPLYQPTYWKPI